MAINRFYKQPGFQYHSMYVPMEGVGKLLDEQQKAIDTYAATEAEVGELFTNLDPRLQDTDAAKQVATQYNQQLEDVTSEINMGNIRGATSKLAKIKRQWNQDPNVQTIKHNKKAQDLINQGIVAGKIDPYKGIMPTEWQQDYRSSLEDGIHRIDFTQYRAPEDWRGQIEKDMDKMNSNIVTELGGDSSKGYKFITGDDNMPYIQYTDIETGKVKKESLTKTSHASQLQALKDRWTSGTTPISQFAIADISRHGIDPSTSISEEIDRAFGVREFTKTVEEAGKVSETLQAATKPDKGRSTKTVDNIPINPLSTTVVNYTTIQRKRQNNANAILTTQQEANSQIKDLENTLAKTTDPAQQAHLSSQIEKLQIERERAGMQYDALLSSAVKLTGTDFSNNYDNYVQDYNKVMAHTFAGETYNEQISGHAASKYTSVEALEESRKEKAQKVLAKKEEWKSQNPLLTYEEYEQAVLSGATSEEYSPEFGESNSFLEKDAKTLKEALEKSGKWNPEDDDYTITLKKFVDPDKEGPIVNWENTFLTELIQSPNAMNQTYIGDVTLAEYLKSDEFEDKFLEAKGLFSLTGPDGHVIDLKKSSPKVLLNNDPITGRTMYGIELHRYLDEGETGNTLIEVIPVNYFGMDKSQEADYMKSIAYNEFKDLLVQNDSNPMRVLNSANGKATMEQLGKMYAGNSGLAEELNSIGIRNMRNGETRVMQDPVTKEQYRISAINAPLMSGKENTDVNPEGTLYRIESYNPKTNSWNRILKGEDVTDQHGVLKKIGSYSLMKQLIPEYIAAKAGGKE